VKARLAILAVLMALATTEAGARPRFACPVTPTWGWLASPYGWRAHPMGGHPGHHWGIDIAAPHGTPVLASMAGTVSYTGWHGTYGLVVYIRHHGDWATLYGHLSRILVRTGQQVGCAQVIGTVGSTGLSTGPHLHFEMRYRDMPVDPVPYLVQAYRRAAWR